MLWRLKEGFVMLDGRRIDYAAFGKGEIPLVVIPGLSLRDVKGAGWGLALMYRKLARDHRIYVLDKSAQIPEGWTVADLAEDTVAAMRALGIASADLLGISLGGMIAQEIAIRHPSLVRRLVLGVTASRINPTMKAALDHWIALAEAGDFGGIVRDMPIRMYSKSYARRYRLMFPILARFARPKDPERFVRLTCACLTCEAYDRLSMIGAPTLVLGGMEDRIVTAEASLEIAAQVGCEIHMYEGLGHAAYEEAADFNRRVKRFLSGEGAPI